MARGARRWHDPTPMAACGADHAVLVEDGENVAARRHVREYGEIDAALAQAEPKLAGLVLWLEDWLCEKSDHAAQVRRAIRRALDVG